jgi:hypothetical protein
VKEFVMSDYIPRNDAAALEWFLNFGSKIEAQPSLYQLTPADAEGIVAAVQAFETALDALGTPETKRNPVLITEKDDARTAAEQMCRQFAVQIKFNAAISDAAKIAAGVRPVNPNRDPIPAPSSSPMLSIFGAGYATHTVRFVDSTTPDSRQKPYGVKQMQLFVHVGDEPLTNPEEAKFHGLYTRSPIGIAFDANDVGKQASYVARWCTMKGEVGPWSSPVHMSIAA